MIDDCQRIDEGQPEPVLFGSHFEELRDDFLIQREIGRGAYAIVFKAVRNPVKLRKELAAQNPKIKTDLEDLSDTPDKDSAGNIRAYAIKRLLPTVKASYIVNEMLVLRLVGGKKNVVELVHAYRLENQLSLVFNYKKS